MAMGWKNPLWRRPSEWYTIARKPAKPTRSARRNDDLIAAELIRARRKVDRERARGRKG